MNLKLIEKKLTNNRIEELFEELGFVEGRIRYCFLNGRSRYSIENLSDDIFIFIGDMIGKTKYLFYCKYGVFLKDDLPDAMSGIIIENNIISFYSYPDSVEALMMVKATSFSLYSLGDIDWETINILEIVKEIERTEG